MKDQDWLSLVKRQRSIGIIRAPNLQIGRQMAKTAIASGMNLIEVSWRSDHAAELIAQLRSIFPNCTIGVGTVLTISDLKNAIAAGAQFAFMPHLDLDLIAIAKRCEVPIIPGALTPTEIVTAWNARASSVKIFPVEAVGNASYLKALHAPLGHIPMIPTGGVTIENASSFIQAGAIAVGIGGNLFPKAAIESGNWTLVQQRIKTLIESLQSDSDLTE